MKLLEFKLWLFVEKYFISFSVYRKVNDGNCSIVNTCDEKLIGFKLDLNLMTRNKLFTN